MEHNRPKPQPGILAGQRMGEPAAATALLIRSGDTQRASAGLRRSRRGSPLTRVYESLDARLAALPPEQDCVVLSFPEIEALRGMPLPRGALLRSYWTTTSIAWANWRRLGFRATLLRAPLRVEFTRERRCDGRSRERG